MNVDELRAICSKFDFSRYNFFQKATSSAENFDDLISKMHKIEDNFFASATEIEPVEAEKFWNAGKNCRNRPIIYENRRDV